MNSISVAGEVILCACPNSGQILYIYKTEASIKSLLEKSFLPINNVIPAADFEIPGQDTAGKYPVTC